MEIDHCAATVFVQRVRQPRAPPPTRRSIDAAATRVHGTRPLLFRPFGPRTVARKRLTFTRPSALFKRIPFRDTMEINYAARNLHATFSLPNVMRLSIDLLAQRILPLMSTFCSNTIIAIGKRLLTVWVFFGDVETSLTMFLLILMLFKIKKSSCTHVKNETRREYHGFDVKPHLRSCIFIR